MAEHYKARTERPREGEDNKPEIKRVGGARNAHGTRIARRVQCRRCEKSDHVAYVPKDRSKALCRDCAAEVLKAYEFGVRPKHETTRHSCTVCLNTFDLPSHVEDDGELCCQNCLRGFMAWKGKVGTPPSKRVDSEERPGGTRIRKRKQKQNDNQGDGGQG